MPSDKTAPGDTYALEDLAQLKALADPLRVRILEALAEEPRTTKQVAVLLGEKPTKLYHHVDALEKVGLVRLESTKQNRGTLEKYYRAVARYFRAGPGLFMDESVAEEEGMPALAAELLEQAAGELRGLVAGSEDEPLVASLKVRATRREIEAIGRRLEELPNTLGELAGDDGENDGAADGNTVTYRLVVGFFPVAGGSR